MKRRRLVFAVVAAVCGCARVASPLGDRGPSGAPDLGRPSAPEESVDLAQAPAAADLAVSPPPQRPADLAVPVAVADLAVPVAVADLATPPVAGCHLVINEIQTGTQATGTAEFVEIYNPCPSAVPLDGLHLVYRAVSNTNTRDGKDSSTLYSFAAADTFAAGTYRVLAGSGFAGAHDGTLASGIAESGAVGLRDTSGALVDSVAYGTATASAFVETDAAPAPPTAAAPGLSIERLPNGADTNDNAHDFAVGSAAPTPGAANH